MRGTRTTWHRFVLTLTAVALLAPFLTFLAYHDARAADVLLRTPDGNYYLVYSAARHAVDRATLTTLGQDPDRAHLVQPQALFHLPEGTPVPALTAGSLVSDPRGNRYVLFGGLHRVPDDDTFAANGWAGHGDFPGIAVVPLEAGLLALVARAAPLAHAASANDQQRFDWGYCTSWVAQRRAVPWNGNAIEWYANAEAMGYAVGPTPVPGAILVRQSASWSGYGHVAYVESVEGSRFSVSEMNVNRLGQLTTATYDLATRPPPGLVGFIYWRYDPITVREIIGNWQVQER